MAIEMTKARVAGLPIYTFNEDVQQFNHLIESLCEKHKISFYNPYDNWIEKSLESLYFDACHPTTKGHNILAQEIFPELEIRHL